MIRPCPEEQISVQPIVVIGAGGHGREVLDVIEQINEQRATYEIVGVLDDGAPDLGLLAAYGVPFLGAVHTISSLPPLTQYVIGIGSPAARHAIDTRVTAVGRKAATLRHPQTSVGRAVDIAPGCILFPGVHVTNHVTLGRHVHLSRNSTVAHDCRVGGYTFVAPGAVASGSVTLGEGVYIGTGAVLNPGVSIGANATVGSGAAVIHDVAPDTTVVGVPARAL